MRDSWLKLVDLVLRPARPERESCLRERDRHLAARRPVVEGRTRAIARCVAQIELARAEVFEANDGVVPARMQDLEREWRMLSRSAREGGLMDLWASVAPASWIDRKRWRDSEPASQLDAAIALAADVEGVEAAEAAAASLAVALRAWGAPVGTRIRWRAFEHDFERTATLLAEPLRAAREALPAGGARSRVLERAQHLERDVHDAANVRFPERPLLVGGLAHAAFVDYVWNAASLATRPNPVTSLRELWSAGYALAEVDASGVTIELPPL